MNSILDRLAVRYPHVKYSFMFYKRFLRIQATRCIENYPDKNVSTLLIYSQGELKAQLVGMDALGGIQTNFERIQKLLADYHILESHSFQMQRIEKE